METAIDKIKASVQKTIKASSGSMINTLICLVTLGSEQLFSFTTFRCPCVEKGENASGKFSQLKYVYGWAFILLPAVVLFVIGCGANKKTWKLSTGCYMRSKNASRGCIAGCLTVMEITLQALVAPLTWISVAFLDGKYYACASSVKPYIGDCAADKEMAKSLEFISNQQISQIVGWILVAITFLLGFTFYTIYRCCSPLTYYHEKYARWYREQESKVIEEKAKEQISQEVEKDTSAWFIQTKRPKEDWDKVSTVFAPSYKNGVALYSRFDEWNEENTKNKQHGEISKAAKANEGDSSLDLHNNNSRSSSVTNLSSHSTTTLSSTNLTSNPDYSYPNPHDVTSNNNNTKSIPFVIDSLTEEQAVRNLSNPPKSEVKRLSSTASQYFETVKSPTGFVQPPVSMSNKSTQQFFPTTSPNRDIDATEESGLIMLDEVRKSISHGSFKSEA